MNGDENMKSIIEMKHVSIAFKDKLALKDVSFAVQEGEIFGFLGPSGAGKTTTIKLLTKQLKQKTGKIMVLGKDIHELANEELYQSIGVLSDNSGFYEKMTVYDNLKVFAQLQKLPFSHIDEVLKKTGLYDDRKKVAKVLSRGMKQRLMFSRAILNQPKILFLDEPTSSLDPATSDAVHEMIFELHKQGTTVFLTTHDMHEADALCDRVAFLNRGEICEIGNPDALKLKYARDEVTILSTTGQYIHTHKNIQDIERGLQSLTGDIARIESIEPDLKTIFLQLTGRGL